MMLSGALDPIVDTSDDTRGVKRPMDIGFLCSASTCVSPAPSSKRPRGEGPSADNVDLITALRAVEIDARANVLRSEADFAARFDALSRMILLGSKLVIAGVRHRITEIEFFYRGQGHQDPYTPCDDMQRTCGLWYFHKTAGKYRGGTYKGVDLTFGGDTAHGGILIRGLQDIATGTVFDGPCVCVDHMLRSTGCEDVAQLVARDPSLKAVPETDDEARNRLVYIEYRRPHKRPARAQPTPSVTPSSMSPQSSPRTDVLVAPKALPLLAQSLPPSQAATPVSSPPRNGAFSQVVPSLSARMAHHAEVDVVPTTPRGAMVPEIPRSPVDLAAQKGSSGGRTILKTPRVGLTLKNHVESKERFIMRHYRYLTTTRETKKGKQFIVLAMRKKLGKTAGQVNLETGVGQGTITNYSDLFDKGRERSDISALREVQLDTEELCELYGYCFQHGLI
eukprot:m51a1_g9287 hypothetical protein (450) ;mRNA; f:17373-19176